MRFVARVKRAAALVLPALPLLACGPDFPNSFLVQGDAALLKAPILNFKMQIEESLTGETLKAFPPAGGNYQRQTVNADLQDLKSALQRSATSDAKAEEILAAYDALRQWLAPAGAEGQPNPAPIRRAPDLSVLSQLPAEFADYARGALAFRDGDTNAAVRSWEKLLHRPENERPFRTVWAEFMLGKIELSRNPEAAVGRFRETRQLASRGFEDSLGLAASSLGWEAYAELELRHWIAAVELYLKQAATGDETAFDSLKMVCETAAQPPASALAVFAAHAQARAVMTAYFVSRPIEEPDPAQVKRSEEWLELLEQQGAAPLALGDRLALQAYQRGQFDLSDRWLTRAEGDSPLALWLRAKLLLRDGRLEPAAKLLARLVERFPPGQVWPANQNGRDNPDRWDSRNLAWAFQGEFGTIQLSQGEYVHALDSLLRSGAWIDASYVAERVLSTAELKRYIDRSWPAAAEVEEPWAELGKVSPHALSFKLRYLLARRLARAEQWAAARLYFPKTLQEILDRLTADLRAGHDPDGPPRVRAAALWAASQTVRRFGLDLSGTELAPDWKVFEGNYSMTDLTEVRLQQWATAPGEVAEPFPKNNFRLAVASGDERNRIVNHAPQPDLRFHYRYRAADLAWEAAALMPDNNDETARVLCTAGTWLKIRDPGASDRFYKALVRRCRKTAIGKEAERAHWFPLLDANGKLKPFPPPAPPPFLQESIAFPLVLDRSTFP